MSNKERTFTKGDKVVSNVTHGSLVQNASYTVRAYLPRNSQGYPAQVMVEELPGHYWCPTYFRPAPTTVVSKVESKVDWSKPIQFRNRPDTEVKFVGDFDGGKVLAYRHKEYSSYIFTSRDEDGLQKGVPFPSDFDIINTPSVVKFSIYRRRHGTKTNPGSTFAYCMRQGDDKPSEYNQPEKDNMFLWEKIHEITHIQPI